MHFIFTGVGWINTGALSNFFWNDKYAVVKYEDRMDGSLCSCIENKKHWYKFKMVGFVIKNTLRYLYILQWRYTYLVSRVYKRVNMNRLSRSVLILAENQQSCIWIICILVKNDNRFGKDSIDSYRLILTERIYQKYIDRFEIWDCV